MGGLAIERCPYICDGEPNELRFTFLSPDRVEMGSLEILTVRERDPNDSFSGSVWRVSCELRNKIGFRRAARPSYLFRRADFAELRRVGRCIRGETNDRRTLFSYDKR